MNVNKPLHNLVSKLSVGFAAALVLGNFLVQPGPAFAQTAAATAPVSAPSPAKPAAKLPDVAPAVPAAPAPKVNPASPVPTPDGASPLSVAIPPNAPMPTLLAGLPPPPAFAIAARLFNAGDYAGAVTKLGDIVTSGTYKETAYAPAAIYREAQIQRDYIHNADQAAIANLSQLKNKYGTAVYPGSATINAEHVLLAARIDAENAKKPFSLDPSHFNVYPLISGAVKLTGSKSYSYWIALLIIAVSVRLVLTPLTIKQYKGMREMQRLQPLLKEIQAKYDKDPQVKGQKMMELYKEHNVSPMSGCLPMLLQLPIYYGMYQAIVEYQYHFLHGTFLWINPVTAAMFNGMHVMGFPLSGIIGFNLSDQDIPILLIYSISMYVTQRMMPATDPSQAEMQKTTALMMSVFFFFIFIQQKFASAFVLYWLFSNILGTVTQLYFTRQGLRAPAGVTPLLPSDGDGKGRNGNGNRPVKPTPELPSGNGAKKPVGAKPVSASMGTIAPRASSKKKRR